MSSSYDELKSDIKCWERMFQRQHSRKPTKSDIKAAAPEIQKCYKDYVAIKKQLDTSVGSGGVDIFGAELNKPKEVISEETKKETQFVSITPDLRKKIELKSRRVKQKSAEDALMDSFALKDMLTIKDDTNVKPVAAPKGSSFFAKQSSTILKSLENQNRSISFQEARAMKSQEPEYFDQDEKSTQPDSHDTESLSKPSRTPSKATRTPSKATRTPSKPTRTPLKATTDDHDVFDLNEDNSDFPSYTPTADYPDYVPDYEDYEDNSGPAVETSTLPDSQSLHINEDLMSQENVSSSLKFAYI